MKIRIISDLHLTPRFDQGTFDFLHRLINSCHRVVIAGDFWDGFLCSFTGFLNSPWQNLFPFLLKKQAVYVSGNHDKRKWISSPPPFAQTHEPMFTLRTKTKKLLIEHGHRFHTALGDRLPWLVNPLTTNLAAMYAKIGTTLFGSHFESTLDPEAHLTNWKMRRWAKTYLPADHLLVCGHSHRPAFEPHNRFINTGFIRFGYASFLEINGNRLRLRKMRY